MLQKALSSTMTYTVTQPCAHALPGLEQFAWRPWIRFTMGKNYFFPPKDFFVICCRGGGQIYFCQFCSSREELVFQFFRDSFNLQCPLLIITLYHQNKISIDCFYFFILYKQDLLFDYKKLNLLVELTEIYLCLVLSVKNNNKI